MNLYRKKKQTHRQKKTYGFQRGGGERDILGVWD